MRKSDASGVVRDLWVAGVLLTRLPLPHLPTAAFDRAAQAVWAYPLIGVAVGAVGGMTGTLALFLGLPDAAAAALALAAMMLISGAMHEDGLADVCDGFWGAMAPARRLEIMRDSHIGTYGVLALVIVGLLRWTALGAVLAGGMAPLIAAAALSRGLMPGIMALMPHARRDGLSQSVGRPGAGVAMLAFGIGTAVALITLGWVGIAAILCASGAALAIALLAHRKIGGQTGDVLGAAQQISETAILLTCTALL